MALQDGWDSNRDDTTSTNFSVSSPEVPLDTAMSSSELEMESNQEEEDGRDRQKPENDKRNESEVWTFFFFT